MKYFTILFLGCAVFCFGKDHKPEKEDKKWDYFQDYLQNEKRSVEEKIYLLPSDLSIYWYLKGRKDLIDEIDKSFFILNQQSK